MSFMLLKLYSTTAVVTGNTSTTAANLAKFGNASAISLFSINLESTCCNEAFLYWTKILLLYVLDFIALLEDAELAKTFDGGGSRLGLNLTMCHVD